MTSWIIEYFEKKPKLKEPLLLEGLPGIGNIGKLSVDFIIEKLQAKKLLSFYSHSIPHSVFINEKNLVELPTIELYYKKFNNHKNDLLLLAGDIQPTDERSCYAFSEKLLEIAQEYHVKELITISGIGMRDAPKKPKLYCTGNNKKLIQKYIQNTELSNKLYGLVGPIIGVSGVLLGLASKNKIKSIGILAETYAHPFYLGVKGAREVLKLLNQKLDLRINIKSLDKEIDQLQQELNKKAQEAKFQEELKNTKLKKLMQQQTMYIG